MPEMSKKFVPKHFGDKNPNPKLIKFVRHVTDRIPGKIKMTMFSPEYMKMTSERTEKIKEDISAYRFIYVPEAQIKDAIRDRGRSMEDKKSKYQKKSLKRYGEDWDLKWWQESWFWERSFLQYVPL